MKFAEIFVDRHCVYLTERLGGSKYISKIDKFVDVINGIPQFPYQGG